MIFFRFFFLVLTCYSINHMRLKNNYSQFFCFSGISKQCLKMKKIKYLISFWSKKAKKYFCLFRNKKSCDFVFFLHYLEKFLNNWFFSFWNRILKPLKSKKNSKILSGLTDIFFLHINATLGITAPSTELEVLSNSLTKFLMRCST